MNNFMEKLERWTCGREGDCILKGLMRLIDMECDGWCEGERMVV